MSGGERGQRERERETSTGHSTGPLLSLNFFLISLICSALTATSSSPLLDDLCDPVARVRLLTLGVSVTAFFSDSCGVEFERGKWREREGGEEGKEEGREGERERGKEGVRKE